MFQTVDRLPLLPYIRPGELFTSVLEGKASMYVGKLYINYQNVESPILLRETFLV